MNPKYELNSCLNPIVELNLMKRSRRLILRNINVVHVGVIWSRGTLRAFRLWNHFPAPLYSDSDVLLLFFNINVMDFVSCCGSYRIFYDLLNLSIKFLLFHLSVRWRVFDILMDHQVLVHMEWVISWPFGYILAK